MTDATRRPIIVAPAQKYVVARRGASVVPIRQVMCFSNTSDVPLSFFETMNTTETTTSDSAALNSAGKRRRTDCEKDTPPSHSSKKSGKKTVTVSIFVWPDSTIRDMIEAALSQHRDELLDVLGDVSDANIKLSIAYVYPNKDREPSYHRVGVVSLNGPVNPKVDSVTITELKTDEFRFSIGDILLLELVK